MNNFTTKNLFLASFLYAKGAKFQGVNRVGKICWFLFSEQTLCTDLQEHFYAKTADVNAKEFVDAIRTLKDLVFSGGVDGSR